MEKRQFLSLKDALDVVPSGADAHAIRQFNFMNRSQPASVGALLRDLGFGQRLEKLPQAVSALLEPDTWSEKGYEVVVNVNHSRFRQRFSALHEIAHHYCHADVRDPLAPVLHRATGYTFDQVYDAVGLMQETEANSWADAVIFGANAIEGAMGLYGRDVESLSRHFGFSQEVIEKALRRRRL